MRGRSLNFKCHKRVIQNVFSEPNSAEMTPPQLLDNHVPIDKHLSNMHWVVTPNLIVCEPFILRAVCVLITKTSQVRQKEVTYKLLLIFSLKGV